MVRPNLAAANSVTLSPGTRQNSARPTSNYALRRWLRYRPSRGAGTARQQEGRRAPGWSFGATAFSSRLQPPAHYRVAGTSKVSTCKWCTHRPPSLGTRRRQVHGGCDRGRPGFRSPLNARKCKRSTKWYSCTKPCKDAPDDYFMAWSSARGMGGVRRLAFESHLESLMEFLCTNAHLLLMDDSVSVR